jgi:hypothetical protein
MENRFTLRELAAEARREVAMRRNVYPRFVTAGKLEQAQADRQIEMMEEIVEFLERYAS